MECGQNLKGRSDKKFCDDYCRSSYNYRSLKAEHKELNRIHKILKRNRKILKLFWEAEQRKVERKLLELNGFCFKHLTKMELQSNGKVRYCIYDYAYELEEEGQVKLLR